MLNRSTPRFLALTVAVLASGFAWGQSNRILPDRVERNIRPVIESTLRRSPQVDVQVRFVPLRPENPHPPITISPIADTGISVGGVMPSNRTQGLSFFPGIDMTGWVPPDPNIGVGRTHIVSVVNSDIAFFTKAGVRTFQQRLDGATGWFGAQGAGGFVFDPKCFYDRISRRFFVIALELDQATDTSKVLLGVSAGENPNGTWFKYRIEAKQTVGSATFWMDYPSIGNNADSIAICGNMFGLNTGGWNGVQFIVLPKAPLLTGSPATAFSLSDTGAGSAQIARTANATSTRIHAVAINSTAAARIYSINTPATSPNLTFTSVPIPNFTPVSRDADSANGRRLDGLDGRVFNVVLRGTRMMATHTVSAGPGDNRLACRWYEWEMRGWPVTGNPSTVQAGNVVGASGQDFHMPALETNGAGDISMIFTRSSPSIVADVMITGRKAGDPSGAMGAPQRIFQAQSSAYGGAGGTNRWGDYFDMAVDPVDDVTFWGIGMTANSSGNWMTWIQSWKISASALGVEFGPAAVAPYQGEYVSGGLPQITTADNVRYLVNATLLPNAGTIGGVETTFELARPASAWGQLTITAETNGIAGSTGMLWVFNVQTNQWDHRTSWPLATTDTTTRVTISETDMAKYVTPAGRVRIVTRGINPIRRGTAARFLFGLDVIRINATER